MATDTKIRLDDKTQEAFSKLMNGMGIQMQIEGTRFTEAATSQPFYKGFRAAYEKIHKRGINLAEQNINASDRPEYWSGFGFGETELDRNKT